MRKRRRVRLRDARGPDVPLPVAARGIRPPSAAEADLETVVGPALLGALGTVRDERPNAPSGDKPYA